MSSKLIKDVASWAALVHTTDAFDMPSLASADFLVIQIMLRALYPLKEQEITSALFAHLDYCRNTPLGQRGKDTLDVVMIALEPVIDGRLKLTHELMKMIGWLKASAPNAASS